MSIYRSSQIYLLCKPNKAECLNEALLDGYLSAVFLLAQQLPIISAVNDFINTGKGDASVISAQHVATRADAALIFAINVYFSTSN